jgi:predicted GIY-YIG superfamily endonuclease
MEGVPENHAPKQVPKTCRPPSSIDKRNTMSSSQPFLFAPEKPLVKRLGKRFFKKIPQQAGVYKMHDAEGKIVYIGKAKNLKQRLQDYRVANPERMSRRHLRLLQEVTRIEFDLCLNESAALKHEAKLIRELKPKFNKAGVWQGKPQFLVWRFTEQAIEFSVQETPLCILIGFFSGRLQHGG